MVLGKMPIHGIGMWMGSRTGLDTLEKRKISCPHQKLNHGSADIHPAA